ncbi:MAG: hypothetical protein U0599_15085 [Vicinamibacteria bacterium]
MADRLSDEEIDRRLRGLPGAPRDEIRRTFAFADFVLLAFVNHALAEAETTTPTSTSATRRSRSPSRRTTRRLTALDFDLAGKIGG